MLSAPEVLTCAVLVPSSHLDDCSVHIWSGGSKYITTSLAHIEVLASKWHILLGATNQIELLWLFPPSTLGWLKMILRTKISDIFKNELTTTSMWNQTLRQELVTRPLNHNHKRPRFLTELIWIGFNSVPLASKKVVANFSSTWP